MADSIIKTHPREMIPQETDSEESPIIITAASDNKKQIPAGIPSRHNSDFVMCGDPTLNPTPIIAPK
jgi:hypothetical protein